MEGCKFKLGDCHFCLTVSCEHALSHAPGAMYMYKYTIGRGRGRANLLSPPDPATPVDTVFVLIWSNHMYSTFSITLKMDN